MVGNRAEAEDLLQEIFLQAYNKLSSFEGRAAFGTWLYRLAVNRCLDHLRSAASQRQSLTKSFEESPEPLAVHETTWRRLDLERAILQLPHSYRSAFLLYDVEGLGHREVADILGVAEGTSKSLVHKARLKLRGLLGASQQEKSHE
jgi:RNA polymerase sigma-70 factor (ECF subfamily)